MSIQLEKCVPCKAPEELIALLENGNVNQRAEAAAALTDTPEAVFVLRHAAENDKTERVRNLALHSLIDTVLSRKHLVNESTVGTMVRALTLDRSESVRNTADAGIMLIASDFPKQALPILRSAAMKTKGEGAERLASTLKVIVSLSSLKEMAPKEPLRNAPAAAKAAREPERARLRVA